MKKMIALLTAIMLLLSACSGATVDSAGKELGDTAANITDADNKYVQMVKGGYRTDNPDLTYEDAFSSFFGTPRWKYFEGEDGQNVVEFTGDCTYQDVPVKARIQFVVDEENGTFEAVYLAFNEVPQDTLILSALISKAFEEAATETGETGESRSTDTAGQVFICGIPVQNVMEMSENELIESFGKPDMYTEGYSLEYGIETPEWLAIYIGDDGKAASISADAAKYTYNGQNLMQDEDALAALLGSTYQNLGGVGESFQCQWILGGLNFVVTFPLFADDNGYFMPYSIYVYKADADDNAMEDDYSWVEGDIDYSAVIDDLLVGRWRAQDGGYAEFDEYGNASVSFKAYPDISRIPDNLSWEANNGRLVITSHFSETMGYEFTDKQLTLTSYGGLNTKYYYNRDEAGDSLIGTWNGLGNSISTFEKQHDGTLVLYADGTGTMQRGFDGWEFEMQSIIWYTDDTNLYMNWTERLAYDYTVSGNVLTIFFSNGSQIYTKVGN